MSGTAPDSRQIFAPPETAATLYPGKVMHARLNPFGHRFTYRVFCLLLDLDRLQEADRSARFFSINKRNLVSFHEGDHILKDSNSNNLRSYIDSLIQDAGQVRPARIMLIAYPRILNFVFNPLSVYFCYDASDSLTTIIYEVRNTFGERHTYVCAIENGQLTPAGVRQERTKIFYVSPFIDLGARYHFRIQPPGDTIKLRIFETEDGAPLLSATYAGTAKPFTTASLMGQLARMPFMTFKIVAGIHWQALKLWLKGAKFYSRGKPPEPVSTQDAATPAGE